MSPVLHSLKDEPPLFPDLIQISLRRDHGKPSGLEYIGENRLPLRGWP